MDYRRSNDRIYLRLDKGDEMLSSILEICRKENLHSAVFHGIGAASEAVVATLIPEEERFLEHKKEGMLEMISLIGNITHDDDRKLYAHAHVMFSYMNENGVIEFFGGHLLSAVTWYTGEIVLDAVGEEGLGRQKDACSDIMVWKLHGDGGNAADTEEKGV